MTHRAAVLGKPIAHSLSPALHNAGYAAPGLTGWSYDAIECGEADLPGLLAGLGPGVGRAVADHAAQGSGAVGGRRPSRRSRPRSVRPTRWYAGRTAGSRRTPTWWAWWRCCATLGLGAGANFVVLGAGGTARAGVAAANAMDAGSVSVVARRRGGGRPRWGRRLVPEPWPGLDVVAAGRRGDLDRAQGRRRPAGRRRRAGGRRRSSSTRSTTRGRRRWPTAPSAPAAGCCRGSTCCTPRRSTSSASSPGWSRRQRRCARRSTAPAADPERSTSRVSRWRRHRALPADLE